MEIAVFQRTGGALQPLGSLVPNKVLGGFREGSEYLLRVPASGFTFFVDDAPLALDPAAQYWRWSPGFFAGEVVAEMEISVGRGPIRYFLDVEPAPAKTGREQYLEYIEEIADYAPRLLLGTEPARHGLGGRSASQLAVWISYARLQCFIDDYLKALHTVCDRPLFRQRHYREQVRLHSAHRVDRHSVLRLQANPELFAAIALRGERVARFSQRDDRLDVPFNAPTFDHPANRLLAEQLGRVQRMMLNLLKQFSSFQDEEGETETAIQPRMARRLHSLQKVQQQLLRLSRKEPFASVDSQRAGIAGITAVTASPAYARSHQLGVRILREGISGLADDEQHYLAPTWQVYEAWCFVALARQLEKRLPDFEWQLDTAPVSADMILTGSKGAQRLRLYSQLVCPSLENKNRYGYTSISRERRPDIVFESSNGPSQRFICLDAKYRTSRSGVLDAMASAHIYRDSVKLEGKGPEYSFLLLPKCREIVHLSTEDYRERNRIGCLSLASQQESTGLTEMLTTWANTLQTVEIESDAKTE